ncbi:hypothetical protein CG478_004030 [Bacillus cytotoxicus]|nr:hypothetical protein CG483_011225 [Bacillus cytotoxicus]AWC39754.1 hypothetical protein CG480_004030 [Bacillus cytotoxicus]AWC47685.1 hypothetical protein CG478_004030 [Bacillus cytotoxicus]AWC52929.1 hypothetical protein CG477_011180 [Bacillus cytotoxicus]AWC57062.1 hypothetical protein CG476_011210 [Bacillus cytotoxicus]
MLLFEVIVKYVLTDGRYAHVIRKKRVNVTGTLIAVTGRDSIWKKSSWLCTSFNRRTST